eukprot:scaffold2911_cov414-Prasinococcus_capsulatus_cf.AAC.58
MAHQAEVSVSTRDLWENQTIREGLEHYFSTEPWNAMLHARLRRYAVEGRDTLCVFMKCHPTPAHQPKYHRIGVHATLADQLRHKSIVEYPSLIVALATEAEKYPLEGGQPSKATPSKEMIDTGS